ncbi:MAG: hypothetical protein ACTHLU_02770 [Novosphingobium sp.]
MRIFLTAAVLTVALAGCNDTKTYQLSAGKVRSTLLSTRVPSVLLGMGAGSSMVTPTGDDDVRWTILTRDNKPLMSLVGNIHAKNENETQVWVTAEPVQGNSAAAKGMEENPAIVKLYVKGMTEQIAAKLEKREFNMAAIQREMTAAAFATIPKMQKEAAKAMDEYAKMSRDVEDADNGTPGQPDNALASSKRSY